MEGNMISVNASAFNKLVQDVALMKSIILPERQGRDPEGELSDWTKNELKEAKLIPRSKCVSHEQVGQMILQK